MKIKVTYEVITQESAINGDCADNGWENEQGIEFDHWQEAAQYLIDQSADNASSGYYHDGVWYSDHGSTDYATGEETILSYHLDGFTAEDEAKLYQYVIEGYRPTYYVRWNIPGYMPESDPLECESLDDAWDCLLEEVKRYAEQLETPQYSKALRTIAELERANQQECSVYIGDYVFVLTEG